MGPVLTAQVRFKPAARLASDSGSLDAAVTQLLVVAVVAATLVAALATAITGVLSSGPTIVLLIVLAGWCLGDAMRGLTLNEFNVVERHRGYALLRIAGAIALPAGGIAACLLAGPTWPVFLSGSVIGGLLLGLGSIWLIRSRGLFTPGRGLHSDLARWRRDIRAFAIPLIPLAATSWVIHLVDRFLLEAFHDASSVGRYAALYSLASQPFIMLSSVATLLFRPRLFSATEASSTEVRSVYREWLLFVLLSGIVGLIALWLLRDALASLLVAQEYRQDTWLVGLIGGGYLFLALAQAEENALLAHMDSRRILAGSVAAAATTLTTGFILIPRWGVVGAAWSTLMALVIYWLVMRELVRRGSQAR